MLQALFRLFNHAQDQSNFAYRCGTTFSSDLYGKRQNPFIHVLSHPDELAVSRRNLLWRSDEID